MYIVLREFDSQVIQVNRYVGKSNVSDIHGGLAVYHVLIYHLDNISACQVLADTWHNFFIPVETLSMS